MGYTKVANEKLLKKITNEVKKDGVAYVDGSNAEVQALIADGKIEVNTEVKNDAGLIAARIPAAAATAEAPAKLSFPIISGIMPDLTRRSGAPREEVYPFSQLEVGQSFFTKADAEKFASTVTSANRRFAVKVDGQTKKNKKGEDVPVYKTTKKFVVRAVTAGQTYAESDFVESESGSRVFRIA
jgi:hypothetical protein